MASASLFEQLTSSVSLSMMTIVSVVTLAVILLATVACRVFFSSTTKSKSGSASSKQQANKDKKTKDNNAKKQSAEDAPTNKKKTNTKAKKSVAAAAPVNTTVSSSSTSSQSEESEEEKMDRVPPPKKSATSNKVSTGKKGPTAEANSKPANTTNDNKTSSAKQQTVPARAENVSGAQSGDAKKKQAKPVETPAPSKQQPAAKNNASNKVNATASNKKVAVVASAETTQAVPDEAAGFDQEDEGQWVTQGGKQVNNRNRTKGKSETTTPSNHQQSPRATSNRKGASEKPKSATNAPSTSRGDWDAETAAAGAFDHPTPPPAPQEPIEICQLLPTGENRYTASDNWWKQPLNQQQTFSVTDIGDWPERDQEEQYVIEVKRIVPMKKANANAKTALTEKDVNVDGNDQMNHYTNAQDDDKPTFDEQTMSSSALTGESTSGTSQSKKKSTNVRRIS